MKYFIVTPVAALIILLLFLLMVQLAGLGLRQPVSSVKLVDPAGFDLSKISFEQPSNDALMLPVIELPNQEPLPEPLNDLDIDFSEVEVELTIDPLVLPDVELDFAPLLVPIDDSLSEIVIPKPVVKPIPKKVVKKPVKKITKKAVKKTVNKVTKKTVAKVAKTAVSVTKQTSSNTLSDTSAQRSTSDNKAQTSSGRASKPISQVRPRYPKRARRRGIEGEVVVSFVIAKNGSVERGSLRITRSQPAKVFDKAVLKALAKWTFPSSPRAHRSSQRLVFKLDK
ncbi:MAG: energy transducer TonB [Oceanospirillaceae bacterium]|nr:energy transducer TonB [Oceanospirillaceae bacterium]